MIVYIERPEVIMSKLYCISALEYCFCIRKQCRHDEMLQDAVLFCGISSWSSLFAKVRVYGGGDLTGVTALWSLSKTHLS